jgi:dihydrofolate reductase
VTAEQSSAGSGAGSDPDPEERASDHSDRPDRDHAPDVPENLTVVLIAAVAENGVLGRGGTMPWHYPEDLRQFQETTMGHPVVLGRRTFESILDRLDEPLPGRTNLVLTTRDLDFPAGAMAVGSVEEALAAASERSEVVYVAGGASVYRQLLPLADRLVITEIHECYEGDARFPEYDRSEWVERDRDDREELSFVEYERA